MECNVLFIGVQDGGGEKKQMKQSGGISTVYGVAGRRRCISATRLSLVTSERKNSGRRNSCRRCVKKLMRRIGERGSNYFANYHFKQWIALEPSSDVYRETYRDTTTKEPTNHPTHNHQSRLQAQVETMSRNGIKETSAPMGAQDRGEAQHGSTTRRRVGGTLTRAYG